MLNKKGREVLSVCPECELDNHVMLPAYGIPDKRFPDKHCKTCYQMRCDYIDNLFTVKEVNTI